MDLDHRCITEVSEINTKKTQKSTNIKSLTKIVRFEQFLELGRISHDADVVGQSVPGGRTRI